MGRTGASHLFKLSVKIDLETAEIESVEKTAFARDNSNLMIEPFRNMSCVGTGIPTPLRLAGILSFVILLAAVPSVARQQQQPTTTPSSDSPNQNALGIPSQSTGPQPENIIKNDRLFGVIIAEPHP